MSAALLELRQLAKSFGGARALRGVDFDLRAGEVHALLGENGAGKSTLIKIVTGAHQPDGGTIAVAGERVSGLTPAAAHRLGIACIYQQPALFPDLTVAENIALRLEPGSAWRQVQWPERRSRAQALLARAGAAIAPDAEVRSLSMPEQQLVEIACALGAGARIVIMDEPTASLTQQEQHRLFAVVRDLRKSGVGVIYISHRLEEIFALADRVTVLRDGESVGTRAASEMDEASLIRMMVGREMTHIYPPSESAPGGVVLAVKNLGCADSGVHDVSFELRAGEVFGLAGLVGAGRTELARMLFGITPADTGEIRLEGERVSLASPQAAVARGIAYVPEDRRRHGVVLEMPIEENITMAVHRRLFPGAWLRFGAERALALRFIGDLAVKCSGPDAPGRSLSGGNQQKVALARWLATQPKVLILDEPTQGVDVGAKSELHRTVRQLAKEGLAVLLISSDLPEIVGMSDRIGVMRGGTLTAVLPGNADPHTVMSAALGQEGKGIKDQRTKGLRDQGTNKGPKDQGTKGPRDHGAEGAPRALGAFSRYFRELSVAGALLLVLTALAIFAPGFFQAQPLLSLAAREAPTLVVACGMALVIIGRQIDISVGSQFAVCSVAAGVLAAQNLAAPLVAVAAVALGALLGAINGVLVAGLRLPSIVVTLATMVTWREGLRWQRQGEFVNLPDGVQWFGLPQTAGQWTLVAIALALLGLIALAMRHLAAGRFVHAVGTDAEAARLAGIRPQLVTFATFVFLGALTGLAAMMNVAQSPQVDPKSGTGLELKAIAAVVVGGVAISGGRGHLPGVFAGLLLLACVAPALTHLRVEAYWEKAIQGAIILLAVVADGLRSRKRTTQ